MPKPRNETLEQRQARTAKARAARLAKAGATPEERSEHYRKIAQIRWANHRNQSGADDDRDVPVEPGPLR